MRFARAAAAVGLGVMLVVSLGGCANIAEQATKAAVEKTTGVKVDQNGGKTTVTDKNGQTTTLSTDQNKLPDGLPSDMPAYTGTIKASASVGGQTGTSYTFTVETTDDVTTILDWYKKELTDKGWTVNATSTNGDAGMISAKKGENQNAVVTVGKSSDGKSEVSNIYEVKK
jgi:hypothetical protein